MEYEPEGLLEKAGDVLGIPFSEVESDLNRFREFMEKAGSEIGTRKAPSGAIETSEPTMVEVHTSRIEQPAEQQPPFQDREIPPATVITDTEAIASGLKENGRAPIAGEGDETRLIEEHGTVIADTPRPEAIEGSSVEENVEIDPGSTNAPTHEQIARRAYELYLERGETPGDEREDWLRPEKELSEREGATSRST